MKSKISILFSLFFFLFSYKFVLASPCSNISITSQNPFPIYQNYKGVVWYIIKGQDIANGSKYKIKINCAPASHPSSNAFTGLNNTLTFEINADNMCLQNTYETGPKPIMLTTENNSEICQVGTYQTVLAQQCTLNISPQIVNPGNPITLSINNTLSSSFLTLIIFKNNVSFERIAVFQTPFSINYPAPGEQTNYEARLVQSGEDTLIYCRNSFSVSLNPPTPTPSPTPTPTSTPAPTLPPGAPTYTPTPTSTPPPPPGILSTGTTCPGFTLKIGSYNVCSPVTFLNFGEVLTRLLPFVFVIAGLILFFLIVSNGLKLLTSVGNPKTIEEAKQGLTAALVGFLLVMVSYWLIQMAEFIFHIKILGGP